jgi:LacI family transcriptional regulator
VRHLHEQGHRRIGFIGNGPGVAYSYARYAGYAQAMAAVGLQLDPSALLSVTEPPLGWDELADRVAAEVGRGVTAFVCCSDGQVNYLHQRLPGRGLRVPQDLSLTGYDGGDTPPWMPRLTTVRVPFVEMGVAAVARLAERIDSPSLLPRQTMLNGEVVIGETTGAAPQLGGM